MESLTGLAESWPSLATAIVVIIFIILWSRETNKREQLFLDRQQAQADANEKKAQEQAAAYAAKLEHLAEENAEQYKELATELSKKYEVALATVLEVVKANTAAMQQTATINDVLREIRKFAGDPSQLENSIPNSVEGC